MTATITIMDYRLIDVLNSDQLEVDDLIGLGDEIVKIISIAPLHDGFSIVFENEFGEKEIAEISDNDKFELYFLD
jgi:hypothetical protein